jgi:hypothetical protein
VRVMESIGRLGWPLIGVALSTAVVMILHVLALIPALASVQREEGSGWLTMILCCWSGMFWATFLFRWLGVWYRRVDLMSRPIASQG